MSSGVHQQIEGFEDDRADEGIIAVGLADGVECCPATEQMNLGVFDHRPIRATVISKTNRRFPNLVKPKFIDDALRKHKLGSPGVDDSAYDGIRETAKVLKLELKKFK